MKSLGLAWLIFISCLCDFEGSGQTFFQPETFHSLEFAHRGGYYDEAENTIDVVVKHLRKSDIVAVEIDLTLTKDGKLILFHDDTINRILQFEESKTVFEMTADDICSLPFRKRGFEDFRVSRFEDFVDTMIYLAVVEKRNFLVELDFKTTDENRVAAVNELLRIIKGTENTYQKAIYDYFFVSSFYPETLKLLRGSSDDVVLAFATFPFYTEAKVKSRIAGWLMTSIAKKYNAKIVETNQCYVTKRKADRWKRKGFLVHSFTANSADEKSHLKSLNIAITSDCPTFDHCPHDPSDAYIAKRWCKKCITGELQPDKN